MTECVGKSSFALAEAKRVVKNPEKFSSGNLRVGF
jgi:hypothetical protein